MEKYTYIVVGAGLWGSIMAERIANVLKEPVLLLEARNHIGGNCYSTIDSSTGIEKHIYGTHIFHTSNKQVWDYINQFTTFNHYRHCVFTLYKSKMYNFPVNLKTINDFYGICLQPAEVQSFLQERRNLEHYTTPQNLEEQAINFIGRELYEAFVQGYTEKQWEKSAKDLPASIIHRIPVRQDYQSGYFEDIYEGIPKDGYGKMFERFLSNPFIQVMTNTTYRQVKDKLSPDAKIYYTGPIDEFFDYVLGELEYRSLDFEWENYSLRSYQGNSVINYADFDVPFTRIHEFKYLHPERQAVMESQQTLICREYPLTGRRDRELYYPINTAKNMALLLEYKNLAMELYPHISFKGRLGGYRYADMDDTVADVLEEFEKLAVKRFGN